MIINLQNRDMAKPTIGTGRITSNVSLQLVSIKIVNATRKNIDCSIAQRPMSAIKSFITFVSSITRRIKSPGVRLENEDIDNRCNLENANVLKWFEYMMLSLLKERDDNMKIASPITLAASIASPRIKTFVKSPVIGRR
jgi:hypothetical protein